MWFRASYILLVVAHFAVLAASKSFSAAYEKIWLYYAYNLAFKFEGPSQPYILRQLDPKVTEDRRHTNNINNGNRGSLPDGQMTWKEFMTALNNLGGEPYIPDLLDDIEKTADDIWHSSGQNKMMVQRAAANWKKPPINYNTYIESLGDMITRARADIVNDFRYADELKKLNDIGQRIVSLRRTEFLQDQYLGADLRRVFPNVIIHTDTVSNPGNPSRPFEVVNLRRTLQDPESEIAIKAAVGASDDTTNLWKKKFIQRFQKYGETSFGDQAAQDNPFANEPSFKGEAQQHRAVLTIWENNLEATERIIC